MQLSIIPCNLMQSILLNGNSLIDNSLAHNLSCWYFLQLPLTTLIYNDNAPALIETSDKITSVLDIIAKNLTPAPWWHVFLDPSMVLVTSVAMLGAQWYFNKNERHRRQEERKLDELQEIERTKNHEVKALNTAIAGLVDIKTVLLILKGKFVQTRHQNIYKFKATLNHAALEAVKKESEEEKGKEMMKWYNEVSQREEYKAFFEFIPEQHINHPYYPNELAFIAKSYPQYLLPLHRVHGFIKGIDEFIDKYNTNSLPTEQII